MPAHARLHACARSVCAPCASRAEHAGSQSATCATGGREPDAGRDVRLTSSGAAYAAPRATRKGYSALSLSISAGTTW
jgi:hypothetical protein